MTLTKQHKEAMALGRVQSRVVLDYLERLQETKPRRGRKRSPETITKRLAAIEAALPEAGLLAALHLTQERSDLQAELARLQNDESIADKEEAFVEVAKDYGERKGLSPEAWRAVGVTNDVLKKAGIL